MYQEQRNLDGVYFRVQRNGKWMDICYSDMTTEERDIVTAGRSAEWMKGLANAMADALREVGEEAGVWG